MAHLESALYDIGRLESFSRGDSAVHRLDPRAKVLTTLVFIVVVASFGRYQLSRLLPLVIYPVALGAVAGLPFGYFVRKLILVAPFVLFVGAFNPLFDRQVLVQVGPVGVWGGWISFLSILVRFALTVSAALVMLAVTGFYPVCLALERLCVPRVFVVQLLFLYRYLFVLATEALRVVRAHSLRAVRKRGMSVRVLGSVVGQLLLRTMDRAQRIHQAMRCRGFDREVHWTHPLRFGLVEMGFVLGWSAFFLFVRGHDVPRWLGRLLVGGVG